jgi:hypothetical protein
MEQSRSERSSGRPPKKVRDARINITLSPSDAEWLKAQPAGTIRSVTELGIKMKEQMDSSEILQARFDSEEFNCRTCEGRGGRYRAAYILPTSRPGTDGGEGFLSWSMGCGHLDEKADAAMDEVELANPRKETIVH